MLRQKIAEMLEVINSLTLKPPLHLSGDATHDSDAPLVGGQLVANRMVHSISAAQCLSSGWCFSCTSSAHFRLQWDACWSWLLLKTENHYVHQQNWMQTGNQRKSIRKRKQRLFHLSNWKMVLLLSRAAASNFLHDQKTHLTHAVLEGVHSLKRKLRIEIQLAGPVNRSLLGPCLFQAKKCWFYPRWILSNPNCSREISGLEGCLN